MGWGGFWGGPWAGDWGGYGAASAPAPSVSCIKTRRVSILGKPIGAMVARAFKGKLHRATLVRVCAGTRTPGNLAGGTNAETHTFAAEGFCSDYDEQLAPELVKAGARRILLIAGSIKGEGYTWVVPEQGDRVTIEDTVYAITAVRRDPATATYTLDGRKA